LPRLPSSAYPWAKTAVVGVAVAAPIVFVGAGVLVEGGVPELYVRNTKSWKLEEWAFPGE
jgi:hypothetical protein